MKILQPSPRRPPCWRARPHSRNPQKPMILLVHGAFADASSWNGVIAILEQDGYGVVAVANPLRGSKHDAQYLADIVSVRRHHE